MEFPFFHWHFPRGIEIPFFCGYSLTGLSLGERWDRGGLRIPWPSTCGLFLAACQGSVQSQHKEPASLG